MVWALHTLQSPTQSTQFLVKQQVNHLPGEATKKQLDPSNLHVQAKACVLDLEKLGKHEKFNYGIGLSLQKTPDSIANSFKGHLNPRLWLLE